MNQLTEEDYIFLRTNPNLLQHSFKLNRVQLLNLFSISNRLTGKNERPGSCGRCLYNVRERLKIAVNNWTEK